MDLVADSFAGVVSRSSPKGRARVMRGPPRRIVLRQIFKGMEREFEPEKAADVDAVIRWEIGGRADGGADLWQVVIGDGRCGAGRKLDREPTVTIKLDDMQFLELVTGLTAGPVLFMSCKLKIEGDLTLAMRLPAVFRVPRAARTPRAGASVQG